MKDKNVLFILTDQWRAECFSYKKHAYVKTPNVDKIAQSACNYTNAHTVTPLCSPARGTLITGLPPHVNGVIDNMAVGHSRQKPLSADLATYLELASCNGFKTAYFGKWHLGQWPAEEKGIEFDTCYNEKLVCDENPIGPATEQGELIVGAREKFNNFQDPKRPEDWLPFFGKRESETTSQEYKVMKRAAGFLADNKENPWFLSVSFIAPHFPHNIPEPYFSMYFPDDMELPESFRDRFIQKPWFQNRHWWPSMETEILKEDDWKKTMCAYYGYISFVDEMIGRVLKEAKENDGGRETVCIFTADHGEMLGNHSRFDKGAYFYDDVMRIPLLISNDVFGGGRKMQKDEYCSTYDIAQTLFGLSGGEARYGRDLIALQNNESQEKWPEEAFGAYYKYNGHSFEVRCIATPEYKYSYIPQDIDELYCLKEDPCELNNLADREEMKDIKQNLHDRLLKHMRDEKDYLLSMTAKLPSAGTLFFPPYP